MSLMNLLKFILSNETHLVKICDIFSLASQVILLFIPLKEVLSHSSSLSLIFFF